MSDEISQPSAPALQMASFATALNRFAMGVGARSPDGHRVQAVTVSKATYRAIDGEERLRKVYQPPPLLGSKGPMGLEIYTQAGPVTILEGE